MYFLTTLEFIVKGARLATSYSKTGNAETGNLRTSNIKISSLRGVDTIKDFLLIENLNKKSLITFMHS